MKAAKESGARKKVRILIVDDHPITREGLANLIRQTDDLTVCGEAANAQQSIEMVQSSQPDLVLSDISLPDRSGIELIKDFQAMRPRMPVLIISMHDEALYAERALRAGARGYMMKQEGADRLLDGIREVLAGKICVSRNASASLLEKFSSKSAQDSQPSVQQLTDREFEVFRMLGEGLSTTVIGKRMHVSPKTIETHRTNIKSKLGFRTAAQLISFAARWISSESTAQKPGG